MNAIHEVKEMIKRESENLKDVKQRLKELQERQKREKEVRVMEPQPINSQGLEGINTCDGASAHQLSGFRRNKYV